MSQITDIINHIDRYGSITAKEAVDLYGCYRLAARIADIKKSGRDIDRVMETNVNRNGDSVSYARYMWSSPR